MKRGCNTILLLIVFLLNISFLQAQSLPSTPTFKTPEISTINKFIETPVSLYSGVPNISIPIHSISIKDVQIPIVLNYHSGGIRVDEEATWVGLGWNLDYGGQITRKVKGKPDEQHYFIAGTTGSERVSDFNQLPPPSTTDDAPLQNRIWYLNNAKAGNKDYMADEFYYSAPGGSGRFMYNQEQNKFILYPKSDIKLKQYNSSPNQYGATFPFYYWNLQLANGTSIDYGKEAVTSQDAPIGTRNIKSSWLIKTIRNIYNDSIIYSYDNFSYTHKKIAGQQYAIYQSTNSSGQSGQYPSTSVSQTVNYDALVSSINFPNGTIQFLTGSRIDMPSKRLNEIRVLNDEGNVIKRVYFHYSYFYGNSFDILPTIGYSSLVSSDYKYNRLRLDSITVSSANNAEYFRYRFDYYTNAQMPCKYSFAQDHFGYFNGQSNTTAYSFIPNIASGFFTGGERRVKPDYTNVFALKSITYPEGSKTEFVYENNTAGVWSTPSALLDTYQDDNLLDKLSAINISGYSRSTFNPTPDYTESGGTRVFVKTFTVANSYSGIGLTWNCYTNYGISSLETYMPFSANNVKFKLEKLDNGSYTLIKDWNTTEINYPYTRTSTNNANIFLVDGSYRMTVELSYGNPPGSTADNQPYTLNFTVRWRELDQTTKAIYAGGLRIKDINYYVQEEQLAKKKSFKYVNSTAIPGLPNFTSGRMISFPKYHQHNTRRLGPGNNMTGGLQFGLTFYSNSVLPLETTSGSYSGYEYVDEYDVDFNNSANNLKTSYRFSFTPPYFSQYYTYMNLGMWEPLEWTRGKLLYAQYFKGATVVKKEEYTYYDWSPHLSNGTSEDYVQEINTDLISLNYLQQNNDPTTTSPDFVDNPPSLTNMYKSFLGFGTNCSDFNYGAANHYFSKTYTTAYTNPWCFKNVYLPHFLHYTGFDQPKTKTTTTYDDNGNSIVQNENYYYDGTPTHHQLTMTESANSLGQINKAVMVYPASYSSQSPYNTMISKNILSPVVEQSIYKNTKLLKTNKVNYLDWGNNVISPQNVEEKTGSGSFETRQFFIAIDSKGNMLEQKKANDITKSYIWGYNKTLPIAEAINAKSNEIYFSDFEKNGWDAPVWLSGSTISAYDNTKSHTGRYSGRIDNAGPGEKIVHSDTWINISLSQATKFKYSGWIYSTGPSAGIFLFMKTASETGYFTYVSSIATSETNKWVYIEGEYLVPSNITKLNIRIDNNATGTVWFDDIRVHPSTAQMTTYTYDPLIGITASCDINNRVTYYEYDGFGRLILIRDQNKNILKKFCYNYTGQNTDCITQFGNQQLSQPFTRNNCGSGYAGSQVIYSVPANTYFAGTQAAANTLAQNDINANGQAYANANGTCTLVCTNCTADSRKCINGICERGLKICVNSYFDYSIWMFVNTYYYQWSDGSTSALYVEYNFCNCDGSQCM